MSDHQEATSTGPEPNNEPVAKVKFLNAKEMKTYLKLRKKFSINDQLTASIGGDLCLNQRRVTPAGLITYQVSSLPIGHLQKLNLLIAVWNALWARLPEVLPSGGTRDVARPPCPCPCLSTNPLLVPCAWDSIPSIMLLQVTLAADGGTG